MTDQSTTPTWFTGPIVRGVDYSPTWPTWTPTTGNNQLADSDYANDGFQSLWANAYIAPPSGDPSVPIDNQTNYRNDLNTIKQSGLSLVRLYNWNMARGTTTPTGASLGHLNFLNYAHSLGLKVVVPVSDYFVGSASFSWGSHSPSSGYAFGDAPQGIQNDFTLFIHSITDPSTSKIHAAVHSISVGNEGDIGQGIAGTTASQFLSRTLWWIVNLHQQINGSAATGPDGSAPVNGASGRVIPISATFSNGDQGGNNGLSWFKCLVEGAAASAATPNGCTLGSTFAHAVQGLNDADSGYAAYYYNSVNISQVTMTSPFPNSLINTLAAYDSGNANWPGAKFNVPLMFMEVFTENRTQFPTTRDQALAAVNQIACMESYLTANYAGTAQSTTNFMGYNYFEFNDEQTVKLNGLFSYGAAPTSDAQTGTAGLYYGTFPNFDLPVYPLDAIPGPHGGSSTLIDAITALLGAKKVAGSLVSVQGSTNHWEATLYLGSPVPADITPGQYVTGPGIPLGTTVKSTQAGPGGAPVSMTIVLENKSSADANPFTAHPNKTTGFLFSATNIAGTG